MIKARGRHLFQSERQPTEVHAHFGELRSISTLLEVIGGCYLINDDIARSITEPIGQLVLRIILSKVKPSAYSGVMGIPCNRAIIPSAIFFENSGVPPVSFMSLSIGSSSPAVSGFDLNNLSILAC